jgi:hypothetical protein
MRLARGSGDPMEENMNAAHRRRAAKLLCLSALLSVVALSACRKKTPAEKVGDKIENAGDKIEDKIDEAN